jgi:hypothetical protein
MISKIIIDRSNPFDPVRFFGRGWSVVDEDQRSLALTEIDFASVRFENGYPVNEKFWITGEKKLERIRLMPDVRLDAKVGQALLEEDGQQVLRFIHDCLGVSWFELAGTVLRDPNGVSGKDLCFFRCERQANGSWDGNGEALFLARSRARVSPLLPTNTYGFV